MPLALTIKAAQNAQRQLRRACQEVRQEWSGREQRSRRLEAFSLQMRLAEKLGLMPAPVPAPSPRRAR